MAALEDAGRLAPSVLRKCTLFTTLSPCAMCSGTILLYGIVRLVIAENVNFTGEEALLKSRGVEIDLRQDQTCITMMKKFIDENDSLWNEDIGE
jgi:cytosine deaminase